MSTFTDSEIDTLELPKEEKNISFENLLKIAINNLDKIVEI